MELAPGVHTFDTGPFNWYVLTDAGRATVVDCGFPGHYPVLVAGLQSVGLTVADVAAVVLTHAHADHTGFAGRLRRASGAPVYIHAADAAKVARPLQLPWYGLLTNAWRRYTRGMLVHATVNGVFTFPAVPGAVPVADGDTLDVPGRPRVVHTPGHTPGEVVLHLADRGVVLTGDTVVTRDLFTGAAGRPRVPHRLLNMNDADARRSLARLTDLGRVTLLPGHGPAWTGDMREAVEIGRGG